MISKSRAAELADEVAATERSQDTGWLTSYRKSVPYWFNGPQLDGLSLRQRRQRYEHMSKAVFRRPGMMVAVAVLVAVIAGGSFLSKPPYFVLGLWAAAFINATRVILIRRQVRKDAKAFRGETGFPPNPNGSSSRLP